MWLPQPNHEVLPVVFFCVSDQVSDGDPCVCVCMYVDAVPRRNQVGEEGRGESMTPAQEFGQGRESYTST